MTVHEQLRQELDALLLSDGRIQEIRYTQHWPTGRISKLRLTRFHRRATARKVFTKEREVYTYQDWPEEPQIIYADEATQTQTNGEEVKFRPVGDWILVRKAERQATTPSGIIIPETIKEPPIWGQVLATGPGKYSVNGVLQKTVIKPGDRIMFSKFGIVEVNLNDEKLHMLHEEEVMGVLEEL